MSLHVIKSLKNNSKFITIDIILTVVLIASIVEFTYIDVTVHDFYSLPWGTMCYTGNTNPDCNNIQQLNGCPNGGDACIEAKYYAMLSEESFYMAGLMVFIKVAISHGLLRHKVNLTRIFQTFVWGVSPLLLLWTGWEDFLYYAIRGKAIPTDLPWLNNAGFFPYITNFTHDVNVSQIDLYLLMAIGGTAIAILFYLNTITSKEAGLQTPM